MQPTILTVLRSGGEFMPEHVLRLQEQCAQHAPGVSFHCLTDMPLECGLPLTHDWPGWWAKMHLMQIQGPVLYMDLDTSITGSFAPLLRAAQTERFVALRNPLPTPSLFGSGLMAWSGDMRHVYQRFAEDPTHHIRRCSTRRLWGDQGFLAETEKPSAYWQDLFPRQVLSWKVDCVTGVPVEARIVYFHGKPRPWEIGL